MSILNTALIQKLKKLKADKSNVLEKNNTAHYEPTQPYHPVTKKYVDTYIKNYVVRIDLVTTDRVKIIDNSIDLEFVAEGDVVNNIALIFDDLNTDIFTEYTCHTSVDGTRVEFDQNDNINNKYAIVTYMTIV